MNTTIAFDKTMQVLAQGVATAAQVEAENRKTARKAMTMMVRQAAQAVTDTPDAVGAEFLETGVLRIRGAATNLNWRGPVLHEEKVMERAEARAFIRLHALDGYPQIQNPTQSFRDRYENPIYYAEGWTVVHNGYTVTRKKTL